VRALYSSTAAIPKPTSSDRSSLQPTLEVIQPVAASIRRSRIWGVPREESGGDGHEEPVIVRSVSLHNQEDGDMGEVSGRMASDLCSKH
jgi:hypothetical protein